MTQNTSPTWQSKTKDRGRNIELAKFEMRQEFHEKFCGTEGYKTYLIKDGVIGDEICDWFDSKLAQEIQQARKAQAESIIRNAKAGGQRNDRIVDFLEEYFQKVLSLT